MDSFTIARVIHVVAVVLWIGGVAMVTTVILPAVKRMMSREDMLNTFETIEGRFALQAKITTVLTGLSGFYMIDYMNGWERFLYIQFWWLHAMVLVWFLFTIILFILEPFVLHKLFQKYALTHPEKTYKYIHTAHWILLILSIITIIGAVAGSHGLYFI
ncbi:hypothetical protein FHG64_11915 [Antarcticibacterium flavum]|uniref:Copper resistance protein D domain-containing protein n=1 Tax=Antarcticibacterium flavum TaxID=2058175 RepID=A0A5B7X3T6_9FLAO|nr:MULTISPECIES: hypothetical protein [Antarcticibacterium]MCM4158280.1 hypothetical protein [Antarcticibacterium sp. W02-3]QCY70047.1 hypothetical protein FHG64_11915 [Antarcticibacterium flavum]